MRLPIIFTPEEIIVQYNLLPLVGNNWVYLEIHKGMYGLSQVGLLVNQQLIKHLAKYGYHHTSHTSGLWKHDTLPVKFSLIVDNFGLD